MKQRFFQRIVAGWILFKLKLKLPFPLKNHFYKGRRISIRRNWFCTDCSAIFHLLPWKKYKSEPAANLHCPTCGSKSVVWTTFLFMAIVDKKSKDYLHWLLKQKPAQILTLISKRKTY